LIGYFFVITACALWAVDTLIRYPLLQESGVSAFSIVFYEHLLLSIILFVISFKSLKKFKMNKSHLTYFFIVGGIGSALSTLAFTNAFRFLNPSLVILLQKFQPVVAILLARTFLGEKVKPVFLFWALICLSGGVLVSYEDIIHLRTSSKDLTELLFHPGAVQGYILVLFSVCGWGAATVFGKKLVTLGYSDEQILAGRFLTGLLCLTPFLVTGSTALFTHSIEVYSKVSLMVMLSGLLAMYLYYQGLRKLSARACSLTEMFFPLMAVLVNWYFLGATLTPVQIFGGLLLVLGSLVIQLKQY
jgi:drug/metabolite transporter (DMT)-like permease